ncbi:MAG: 3-deoxy-D-manno-octulosonate 8-phosphate phosphatase KdsC [Phycisphaerae bacterium]|nr:3-deoxy-D-manno-octulosonate 8-phosphate phosphatase KdsC [Phycisphaerae bacterium]
MSDLQYKALVLDVDGTMTDGGIYLDDHGTQIKRFDVADGSGIKYFQRVGGIVGILTGRSSQVVEHRARELSIGFVVQGALEKEPAFLDLCRGMKLDPSAVAYMGDDLTDVPAMRRAGYVLAPANAAGPVRGLADYVTAAGGGHGAVREAVEHLLTLMGLWKDILARYGLNHKEEDATS